MTKSSIIYRLDGVDLAAGFGIHISDSCGIQDLPALNLSQVYDWPDYHGAIVDLDKPRYKARSIILDAWIETKVGKMDFARKINAFYTAVCKPGLRQLVNFLDPADDPLVSMVYMKDGMSVEKKWRDIHMFGKFQMKLEEPEPIKRVIRFATTQPAITFRSSDMFNIYWGDGTVDYDVSADSTRTVTHYYPTWGTYYVCFSGNTDSLTEFSTNGTVIWQ